MTKGRMTKKLVAIATTILLLATMAIPVMAAPSVPNTGQITVHKFARNSVGVAHPDNMYSGAELNSAVVDTLGEPLDGAGFTLYEMDMTAIEDYLASNPGDFITGYSVAGQVVTYTFDQGETQSVTATAFTDGDEQFTSSGRLTFGSNDLRDGYYLLLETTSPGAQYTLAAPSVIKLPLTYNNGLDVNRDVHVYPKNVDNTAPIVEKTMSDGVELVNTNEVVPFKISTLFKNTATGADAVGSVHDLENAGVYGSVVITDQLAAYFTYIDTLTPSGPLPAGTRGVEVYIVDGAGNKIGGANLVIGTDYNITGITPGTLGPAANIVVTLTNAGIDEAIAGNAEALVVEFDTVYTGGASAAPGNTVIPVTNSATSVVTAPGGATPPITPPGVFHVPGAAVVVDKVDEEGNSFEGATFALSKFAVPSLTYDETTWNLPAGDPAEYTVAQRATLALEYVVDSTGKPVSATTNANGEVIFNNVPYTDAGITYYLKETATRGGYELPTSTIAVVLDSKADLITAGSSLLDGVTNAWLNGSTVVVTAEIVNVPLGTDQSFSLPLTGGAGTILFTAVGIIVMLGAAVIYLHGKKRNA